jgi:predicted nucleic acid-binding Zn ribbon protein
MKRYLNKDDKNNKRIKRFKLFFWLALFAILIAPIYA